MHNIRTGSGWAWLFSIAIALAGSALPGPASGNPAFDVPLGNPVYDYINQLALPPRVGSISLSSRPFTEAQVCSLLVYAESSHACSDTAINRFYLRQFARTADGSTGRSMPARIPIDGLHTYVEPYFTTTQHIQDSNFSITGVTDSSADSLSKKREAANRSKAGFRLYSAMGPVTAYVDASINTAYSSLETWEKVNDPKHGAFYATIMSKRGEPGHLIGYDDFTAYVKVPLPWFDVKIGNDRVQWGYADSSGLLFSGVGKPFLQVKIDKSFGNLNYSFLIGKLIGDSYQEDRIIYAKHMTWTPAGCFSLGLSDAVLSVNRQFEPLYCMPFLPFYFSEHYLGDQDNRIMSIDAMLRVHPRLAAYGELVVDDIENLTGFFKNNDYGDKWGGVFGLKFFNPLPMLPLSMLRAEIVQIEPWVYTTSSLQGQTYRNYPVNFGQVLGNTMGPHARMVTLDLSGRFSRRLGADLAVRQVWKGMGPGSGVFDVYSAPATYDTLPDGTLVNGDDMQTKSYRFEHFDRDRTVVSGSVNVDLKEWLRLNASLSLAHELKPSAVNLYQAGIGVAVNY